MGFAIHGTISTWLQNEFSALAPKSRGDTTNAFAFKVVMPMLSMVPVVTRLSFSQGIKQAVFLKQLEASQYRALLPFTLEALNVEGFALLGCDERTDVLRLVVGPVKKGNVAVALSVYRTGARPVELSDPADSFGIEDVLDSDGVKVTEIRDSDNFINISTFLKAGSKTNYKAYRRAKGKKHFLTSFTCASNSVIVEASTNPKYGAVWAHPRVAIDVAAWSESGVDLQKLLSYLPDDTIHSEVRTLDDARRRSDNDLSLQPILNAHGQQVSERRSSDGYINATELAASMGVKWFNYYALESARAVREGVAYDGMIDVNTLVESLTSQRNSGTWIHPELAVSFIAHITKEDEEVVRTRIYTVRSDDTVGERMQAIYDIGGHGHVSDARESDGYINASMLTSASTRAPHFRSLTAFFSTPLGRELKVTIEGGADPATRFANGLYGGTWIHPLAAVEFASRCGFEIKVGSAVATGNQHVMASPSIGLSLSGTKADTMNFPAAKPTDTPVLDVLDANTGQLPKVILGAHSVSVGNVDPLIRALSGDDGQMITEMRLTDGFVDLTRMCKSAGKRPGHFFDLNSTKAFVARLQKANAGKTVFEKSPGNGGGSWGHPKLAIKMAGWCSVEFEFQVSDLVDRYISGNVTSQNSRACATSVLAMAATEPGPGAMVVRKPDRPVVSVGDMAMHHGIFNIGTPAAAVSPNATYLMCVGIIGLLVYFKWGRTKDMRVRHNYHERDFPNCVVAFVIECGPYAVEDLEDTIKRFVRHRVVSVTVPRGSSSVIREECFVCPVGEEVDFVQSIIVEAKNIHPDIIQSITFGGKVEHMNERLCVESRNCEHELLMRREDTICVQEREQTAREQEKTKQMALEVEMMRLRYGHDA